MHLIHAAVQVSAGGWSVITRALGPAAAAVIASLPLLVGPMAPLQDWPSHLARVFILHEMIASPDSFWHRYYEVGTFLLPNVVLDVCLLAMMTIGLGVLAAGKVFLVATYVLFCTGFRRLAAAFGASGPLTLPLAALLFYSGTFFIGLVNFVFGLALTLWLVGAWVTQEHGQKRLALAVLGTAAVFFARAGVFATVGRSNPPPEAGGNRHPRPRAPSSWARWVCRRRLNSTLFGNA